MGNFSGKSTVLINGKFIPRPSASVETGLHFCSGIVNPMMTANLKVSYCCCSSNFMICVVFTLAPLHPV